ncbi:MAG: DUF6691 family protein [Bacteriovorax sp.]|jgi:hypothetical protein
MKNAVSFIVGLIFAIGLGISGMTQVHVVRGFLDIFGSWNPALMGVMIGAIGVHSLFYYNIKKKSSPLLDTKFHLPTRKDIDKKLLIGSAVFGIGWGWAGICPGPGIVAATSGNMNILIFVASMLTGMGIYKLIEKKL